MTRPPPRQRSLAFVVHKHDATTLHFDVRLELDGVMKSWAVPKGPSLDPSLKRLAMEVADHPMSYNPYEGTIAAGQYGGGTVMLWDRGTYSAGDATDGESDQNAIRRALQLGKFAFIVHGARLQGAFTLVRTRGDGKRAQWLLIKGDDAYARRGSDIAAEVMTSVASDRTMEEIAGPKRRTAKSAKTAKTPKTAKTAKRNSAKASKAQDATKLEQIPNVGASIAGDLRGIGIESPRDLAGKDPYALYDAVCAATGARHVPCLIDVFISAVRFMDGGLPEPWWHYTPERKQVLLERESVRAKPVRRT